MSKSSSFHWLLMNLNLEFDQWRELSSEFRETTTELDWSARRI